MGDVVKVVALRYSSYNLHGGSFRSLTLCVCVHKHGTGDVYVDMARHDTSQVLPSYQPITTTSFNSNQLVYYSQKGTPAQ